MNTMTAETIIRPSNRLLGIMREAKRRNRTLYLLAAGHLALLALMLAIAPFDGRLVTGVNPWVKPIKFALANAVYILTVGWLLYHLPAGEKVKLRVGRIVALSTIAETVLITLQAARGTTSHFNVSTRVDAAILGVMGLMIVLNTIVIAYMAFRFWRTDAAISAPYLWGIRLGLLIFILASLEGFVMVGNMSHSVGVADGGAGLPIINWNTNGGDLRVAHFFGLHALQVLPLTGYLFSLPGVAGRLKRPAYWVWAAGLFYGGLALLLFLQALAGRPLLFLGA